jgi:hypothetical protein
MASPTAPSRAQATRAIAVTVVVAVVLTEIVGLVIEALTKRTYIEVGPIQIAVSTTLTTVIGGIIYAQLVGRVSWATTFYRILVAAVAVFLSVPLALFPLHPGFAVLTIPMHVTVAISSIVLIPWLMSPGRSG